MTSSFAELFTESTQKRNLEEGSDLLVQVLDINENFVTVSAALKSDARIPAEEFMNSSREIEVKVGDTIEVEIELLEDGRGETVLSRRNARRKNIWRQIEHALENDDGTVEGTIQNRVRGGFSVALEGVRAFLPGSLADVLPAPTMDEMLIGQTMQFKPIKINRRRNSVVLSRRAVIERNMQNLTSGEALKKLEVDMRVTGTVRAIVDYGAFLEIEPGIFGLLHITDMSWRHTSNITELMKIGDTMETVILRIDEERGRISLGAKQLQPDPWEYFERQHPVGSRTFGKVTKIMGYGVFVEIGDQLQGLVHTSEMSWSRRSLNPETLAAVGDEVEVMILGIDRERRRISLGMKQCRNNPWKEFATAYRKGDKIKCSVCSISEFGIFMKLPGDIEGLVYLADISYDKKGEEAIRDYEKGQELETIILSIDPERERIGLGIKQLEDEQFNQFTSEHGKGSPLKVRISEIREKGAIVEVLPQGLRGFLPIGEITTTRVNNINDHLKVGETHDAVLLIDADERNKHHNRIIVSLKTQQHQPEKAGEKTEAAEKKQSTSSLGALVQAELDKSQQKQVSESENA